MIQDFFHRYGASKTNKVTVASILTPTVGLLLKDLRPHGHRGVDDDKPEGDQWDKVIELVRSVHYHTQHQDQEV